MRPSPLIALTVLAALLLLAAGCWSLDGLYDPDRCDPPCGADRRCQAGACVALQDARVDLAWRDADPDLQADASTTDGPALWPDATAEAGPDAPGPDGPAPDGPAPDGLASDGPALDGLVSSIGWTAINKGSFTMGSPKTELCRGTLGSVETQHKVTLTHDFELMTSEVSQPLFQALMGYDNAWFGPNGGGGTTCPGCPVEYLNWHEAAALCNALSAAKGLGQCYSCSGKGLAASCKTAAAHAGQKIYGCPGYRLPTEAEWEYAYRAGTTTPLYSGAGVSACESSSDANANKICWYKYNAGKKPRPVGTLPANPWGLYNLAGNVTEWCHDEYVKDLGAAAATDPVTWGTGTSGRVLRGGNFASGAQMARAAMRAMGKVNQRTHFRGVRCARTK